LLIEGVSGDLINRVGLIIYAFSLALLQVLTPLASF
jgi:hypothetical protein